MIKKVKGLFKICIQWFKEKQYLIYFAAGMCILDFYLRYINRTMKSFSVLDLTPNVFTVMWVLILCLVIYISNKKLKMIFTIIFASLFGTLAFTQIIFSRIFSKFFSFYDLVYTNEGMSFIDVIFDYFKITDLLVVALVIILMFLSVFCYRYILPESKVKKGITIAGAVLVVIALFCFCQYRIGESNGTIEWNSFANRRNIYNQFNDSKRALMLCGLYEYSVRDFYKTFLENKKENDEESIKLINLYFSKNEKNTSEYNGLLKGKNLILVMLENIDTWMIDEKSMPTLYNMKNNSIDFTEHYSVNYSSGFTFNTEFIANTGLVPNITELKTSYSYNKNNYDYSLASLFKSAGYTVNSVHKNKGEFYNRDNMHLAWGYEKHYEYSVLRANGQNTDFDTTTVANNLDYFIYDDLFMTFYITYSAHMPFSYDKKECKENIDYVKEQFPSDNEEYLCAMSQAKITDDAIKMLYDELEKQGKLEDTVFIFFTDHYAYSMNQSMVGDLKDERDPNLKTKTPFFIYNNGKTIMKINKVNTSVDILPTVADLFGLNYNPNIYFGESILNEDYKGIAVFNDRTWYDGEVYYKGDNSVGDAKYIEENNKYTNDLLTIGGKVIETDYFRIYDLDNEKRKDN